MILSLRSSYKLYLMKLGKHLTNPFSGYKLLDYNLQKYPLHIQC